MPEKTGKQTDKPFWYADWRKKKRAETRRLKRTAAGRAQLQREANARREAWLMDQEFRRIVSA